MKLLIYIFIFSFNLFPIGFDALTIPSNSMKMSLSGSGVASRNAVGINPSANENISSTIGFSANKWIVDISGSSFYYTNNGYHFNYYSIGVDDIEVRNEIASDEPLDVIGANFFSFNFSKSFTTFTNLNFGFGAQINYNQIFIDKFSTITFDFGIQKLIINNFQLGLAVKNLGKSDHDLPTNYSLGTSYYMPKTKTELLIDYEYSSFYRGGINLGVIQNIKFLTLNFGYSKFSNLRSTLSSGIKVTLNKKYNFLYSILSIEDTNLGFAHYFGIELSL
tara:strand:- start:19 stop:849 length:831 start_codon:yes stop_codon:yes gene_type:complete